MDHTTPSSQNGTAAGTSFWSASFWTVIQPRVPAINMVVSPIWGFVLMIITKLADLVLDYLGYPHDRKNRIDDERFMVQRVLAMQKDLVRSDPSPATYQSAAWVAEVAKLEKESSDNQSKYKKTWFYFRSARCARNATYLKKRAEELASQYEKILVEPKPKHQPIKGNHWGDNQGPVSQYRGTVLKFIQDNSVNGSKCLGVWGMSGVGKTLLLRQVAKKDVLLSNTNREKSSQPYDLHFRILWVDAGDTCSVSTVQKSIFGQLGIAISTDLTESAMGFALHNRLSESYFLLILDNLTRPLDLAKVGIPEPNPRIALGLESMGGLIQGQKVIITSKHRSVCASMRCDQIIHMTVPNDEDSRAIFTQSLGKDCFQNKVLADIAGQIMEECGHVPEALYQLGRSLSFKTDIGEWELCLKMVRQGRLGLGNPSDGDLMQRLKSGFDLLDQHLKACVFVLACWNDKPQMEMNVLISTWRGLGLIEDLADGIPIIKLLQYHSLLEEGLNRNQDVRLNGLLQKVASLLLREGSETWVTSSALRPACTPDMVIKAKQVWLLEKDIHLLNREARKLKFQLTALVCRSSIDLKYFEFPLITFLDMQGVLLTRIPSEICLMSSLEYLNLSATGLTEVAPGLNTLTQLRVLVLRHNPDLFTLPDDLLGGFRKLELLDLFQCGGGRLLSLTFFQGLVRGNFEFRRIWLGLTLGSKIELDRMQGVICTSGSPVYICMSGFTYQSFNMYWLRNCTALQVLRLDRCDVLEIVAEPEGEAASDIILSKLQTLDICACCKLHKIGRLITGTSLTTVTIESCPGVTDITFLLGLPVLEFLKVAQCGAIHTLFSASVKTELFGAGVAVSDWEFRMGNFKRLYLIGLPKLMAVSDWELKLEGLLHLHVLNCPRFSFSPSAEGPAHKVALQCDQPFRDKVYRAGKECAFTMVNKELLSTLS